MKLTAIVVLALVGIAVAQTVTPIPREVRLVGEIPAEWWTYVELRSSPPADYTVPSGRHFVITSALTGGNPVLADGIVINARLAALSNGTRVAIPPGVVLTCGAPVNLWGYLEPVR